MSPSQIKSEPELITRLFGALVVAMDDLDRVMDELAWPPPERIGIWTSVAQCATEKAAFVAAQTQGDRQ